MALVVEALDCGIFAGPVHALDLTIGPRLLRLGSATLYVVRGAGKCTGVPDTGTVICSLAADTPAATVSSLQSPAPCCLKFSRVADNTFNVRYIKKFRKYLTPR